MVSPINRNQYGRRTICALFVMFILHLMRFDSLLFRLCSAFRWFLCTSAEARALACVCVCVPALVFERVVTRIIRLCSNSNVSSIQFTHITMLFERRNDCYRRRLIFVLLFALPLVCSLFKFVSLLPHICFMYLIQQGNTYTSCKWTIISEI